MTGNLPIVMVFIGGLIALAGGLMASMDQSKNEKALREKSEEIAHLNKRITQYLTGESSYAFAELVFPESGKDLSIVVRHSGENPVYGLSIRWFRLDPFEDLLMKGERLTVGVELDNGTSKDVGELYPHLRKTLNNKIEIPEDRMQFTYVFRSYSRSTSVCEIIHCMRFDEAWRACYVLYETSPQIRHLRTFADPGFPKNSEGKYLVPDYILKFNFIPTDDQLTPKESPGLDKDKALLESEGD